MDKWPLCPKTNHRDLFSKESKNLCRKFLAQDALAAPAQLMTSASQALGLFLFSQSGIFFPHYF